MVNGPKQVYIEQKGKLIVSDVRSATNAHVLAIAPASSRPSAAVSTRAHRFATRV